MDILQRYNNNSFGRRAETIQDMIREFTMTELGVDETFREFDDQAQDIILNIFNECETENQVKEMVDTSNGLKKIFGVKQSGYIKEMDAILRLWKFINDESKAA